MPWWLSGPCLGGSLGHVLVALWIMSWWLSGPCLGSSVDHVLVALWVVCRSLLLAMRFAFLGKAVATVLDLRRCNSDVEMYAHSTAYDFYSQLLREDSRVDPLKHQRGLTLRQTCPRLLADCISRLAVGRGLPADGHVVH